MVEDHLLLPPYGIHRCRIIYVTVGGSPRKGKLIYKISEGRERREGGEREERRRGRIGK